MRRTEGGREGRTDRRLTGADHQKPICLTDQPTGEVTGAETVRLTGGASQRTPGVLGNSPALSCPLTRVSPHVVPRDTLESGAPGIKTWLLHP